MGSDSPSPRQENDEPKAEFRKITNEAASRKYRRHSPAAGSSDEDGSPRRGGKSKVSENNDREDDKSLTRHSRDSYRHSSRSYHSNNVDEDDRSYTKPSSRSGRESRGGTHSDHRDRDSDYNNRSRDHYRDVDRKYKDRYDGRYGSRYDDRDRRGRGRDDRDEKRDYRKILEDSRRHRSDYSKRESGDPKEKSKNDGGDGSRFVSEDPVTKRRKFSSEEIDARKDERQTSGSKQGDDTVAKVNTEQVSANGSGFASASASASNADAAKVAAMKAAEMVNQNLVGTGFMSADQKKKLLWGSKKSTTTQETSHHWDPSLFGDRERQEKFKKLMGVKGDVKSDSKMLTNQDAEKQREVQMDLERQYTAGLRRRDGRTVGLGL